MSKYQVSSTQALRELQAYRRAQRIPAQRLALVRWPDRAVDAGVSAKLARRPTYRTSRPGDPLLARALDWICAAVAKSGVVSW